MEAGADRVEEGNVGRVKDRKREGKRRRGG